MKFLACFSSVLFRPWLCLTLFVLVGHQAYGQALPAGLPPEILDQLRSMTPEQQRELAAEYGFSVPVTARVPGDSPILGAPGAPVSPAPDSEDKEKADEDPSAAPPEEDQGARFGMGLFDREVSTFAPTDDAPVPASYRLGVGDQVVIQFFGKKNDRFKLQIDRSGDISLPGLGAINLGGLTFTEASSLLNTRVSQQLIGVEALVNMGRLRSINVFIAGEVNVPGAYSVSSLTTVSQGLFQAGGITEIGSLRNIRIRRSDGHVSTFDAYDLLIHGVADNDIRLQSGDVLFVPPYRALVSVSGEVKRPMTYEVVDGETIEDALNMAGNFTGFAYPRLSTLIRKSPDFSSARAQSADLTDSSLLSAPIKDGDTIIVPKAGDFVANSVVLKGAVTRPGRYGWAPGLTFSKLIGDPRSDLLANVDLSHGIIVRQGSAFSDIEVIDLSVSSAISNPLTDDDPLIFENDEIYLFSLPNDQAEENSRENLLAPVINRLRNQAAQDKPLNLVSISGAVHAPGDYPLFRDATLATLIRAAGGLKDSAFLQAGELRRLTEEPNGRLITKYEDVNLFNHQQTSGLLLKTRDHLTVREIPNWSPSDSITIDGEVRFPGEYRIRSGEKLTDVINRAGGFTEDAHLESAVFTRKAIAEQEAEQADQFARDIQTAFAAQMLTEERNNRAATEVADIVTLLQSIEGKGRLLIDLDAAMAGDESANIIVRDGDRLLVGKLSNTITVVGEAMRPRTYTYDPNLNVDDYIGLSAGLTRRADKRGIYLVRANGSVVTMRNDLWTFNDVNNLPEPGDTIVIPINTQYKDSLSNWREITQVIYQSVVSIAAVMRL